MTASSDDLPDWKRLFVGREDELRTLTAAWQSAKTRTPTAVALIADSGFGKTRLVHEFYRWLSTQEDPEPGYWPPTLAVTGANLGVNPATEECGAASSGMPFLWWGLRLTSSEGRNALPPSALSVGARSLEPHLGALQRTLREEERRRILRSGGIDFGGDVGMEVAAHGASTLADVALPGFGLVRTLYKQVRTYREVKREQREEAMRNVSPLFEGQRQQANLIETLIDDLRRVVLTPPGALQPIPAVVFVDDIHHAGFDPSFSSFLEALLHAASNESWPLLLLLNSWEHSWLASDPSGSVRGILESGFGPTLRSIQLSRTADLGPIVDAALPGLAAAQRLAMLNKAEGNPEYLAAMIELLRQSPRWFVDRRVDGMLNEDGASRLAAISFADLAGQRLQAAEPSIRQCLSVAACVGHRFATPLVLRAGELLDLADVADGLAAAERAPGFVALARETGEFRQKAYLEAVLEDSANFFDRAQIDQALAQAARELELPANPDADSESLLTEQYHLLRSSPLPSDRRRAYDAIGQLIRLRMDLQDVRGAVELARIWLDSLEADRFQLDPADGGTVDAVAGCLEQWGHRAQALALRLQMLEKTRALQSVDPSEAHLEDLRLELDNVAGAMEMVQGADAAEVYRREALSVAFSLHDFEPSPTNRTGLAYTLMDLARNRLDVDAADAARPLLETSISLQRALLDEEPTPARQLALAHSLKRLGEALLSSEDRARAEPIFTEALALTDAIDDREEFKRTSSIAMLFSIGGLYAGSGNLEAAEGFYAEAERRLEAVDANSASSELMVLKVCFGLIYGINVVAPRAGDGAAAPYYANSLRLARTVSERLNTLETRRLLALLLIQSALSLAENPDRAAQARDLAKEAAAVLRELDALEATASSKALLANALTVLAQLTDRLEGPGPAAPAFQECVELLREASDQVKPADLRRALITLGDNQRALKDRQAAWHAYEEALELAGSMSRLDPSPENLREELILTERLWRLSLRRAKLRVCWRHLRAAFGLRQRLAAELVDQGMSIREVLDFIRSGRTVETGTPTETP